MSKAVFPRHSVRWQGDEKLYTVTKLVSNWVACEKFHKVLDSAPKMDPERTPKPTKGSDHPTPVSSVGSAGVMAGLGLQFALSILLFLWVGQWMDKKFGTAPLFLVLFVFIGAGASFYSMYRKLMGQQRREDEEHREQ